jgi:hypothetical protein
VDVLGDLTDSHDRNSNWKVLQNRLKKGLSELSEKIEQVKMRSSYSIFIRLLPNTYKKNTFPA